MLEYFEQGFQHWKLGTDLLLLVSLGYLGLRFSRAPGVTAHSRQLADLEVALKGLVKEADAAGRSLNDQLLKRQSALEKLLIDVDVSEHRMTRSVSGAEDTLLQIRREQARFEQLAGEARPRVQVQAQHSAPPSEWAEPPPTQAKAVEAPAQRSQSGARVSKAPAVNQPAPLELEHYEEPQPARNVQSPEPLEQEAPRAVGRAAGRKLNIYGEEIVEPAAAPKRSATQLRAQQGYKPLQQQIEKTIEPTPPRPMPQTEERVEEGSRNSVQKKSNENEALRVAEQQLRAGRSVESVSQALRLPTRTVQLLARVLESSQQIAANAKRQRVQEEDLNGPQVSEVDPRLGVFAEIRRETQLL